MSKAGEKIIAGAEQALMWTKGHAQGYAEGRREALEEAARVNDEWTRPSVMCLHAGEMTAQELRTAKAVLRGAAASIRALIDSEKAPAP